MGKKFAAVAAIAVTLGLAGCSSDPSEDEYWQDAAKDACTKSAMNLTFDSEASASGVKVAPDGSDRFKVTGSLVYGEFGVVSQREFTCNAWMDGNEVAGRAAWSGSPTILSS